MGLVLREMRQRSRTAPPDVVSGNYGRGRCFRRGVWITVSRTLMVPDQRSRTDKCYPAHKNDYIPKTYLCQRKKSIQTHVFELKIYWFWADPSEADFSWFSLSYPFLDSSECLSPRGHFCWFVLNVSAGLLISADLCCMSQLPSWVSVADRYPWHKNEHTGMAKCYPWHKNV